MSRRGRRPVLDEAKKREIVALLSAGCSRRVAARYVGCSTSTIAKTASRDPQFARKLRQAQYSSELTSLQSIRKAAQQERYWRAAAWVLERRYPQRYAARGADTITVEQISQLLKEFAAAIVEVVPVERYRKAILQRLGELARRHAPPTRRGTRSE